MNGMTRIYFVHIMKTAGTSFRRMLMDEYGVDSIYPNDNDLKNFPNGHYPPVEHFLELQEKAREHRITVGHYPYGLYKKLASNVKVATFVRDPVARTISMIEHRKRYSPEFRSMSYEEILNHEVFVTNQIRNYQTKVLGMYIGDVNSVCAIPDEKLILRALNSLDCIEFVGITERFDESCRLFDHLFDREIEKHERQSNVGSYPKSLTDSIIEKIKDMNRLDIRIYEAAVNKFNKHLLQTVNYSL